MGTYKVTDPSTGRTIRLQGDSPPTEQELEQIFSQYQVQKERSIGEKIVGAGEALSQIATGTIAQPIAGLAGIARGINPFAPEGSAAQRVEEVQRSLTYQPQTEAGAEYVRAIGNAPIISDIANVFEKGSQKLGDLTYEATGSPAAAAVAKGVPEAAFAALGAKAPSSTAASLERKAAKLDVEGYRPQTEARLADVAEPLKRGDVKGVIERIDSDPEFYQALDDLGITAEPLASYGSRNPEFRGIEQSFAALPNSPQNAQSLMFARDVSNVAQAIAEKFDAGDAANLSAQWRGVASETVNDLGKAANMAYDALDEVIDRRAVAEPKNTMVFIEDSVKDLAGGIDDPDVPKPVRDVIESLKPRQIVDGDNVVNVPPTYANLDLRRKEIGKGAFENQGPFKDADKALLKTLYGKITDDLNAMAEAQGLSEQVKAAKSLVSQRKGIEERMTNMLGNQLQKDVIPVVQQGLKGLSSGRIKAFEDVMKNLEPAERNQMMVGAINDMFTKTLKGERQFGTMDYLKWYNGAMKEGKTRELITANMDKDAVKALDDLAKVSKGIAVATSQKIPTGIVNSVLSDEAGFMRKLAGGAASLTSRYAPIGAAASDTIGAIGNVLSSKTARAEGARELLASPEFQRGLRNAVASGMVEGRKKVKSVIEAENRVKKTEAYRKWASSLGDDKAKLASMGLFEYLLQQDETQNQ